MGLTKKNMHFCLFFPAWKVSTELWVIPGGPEKSHNCFPFIYFLTGKVQKLSATHIESFSFFLFGYILQ